MRKTVQLVLTCCFVGAAIAWSIYDWIFVDEGFQYFREDRSRIFLLLGIIAIGTPILLGYEALSVERKRGVALCFIGILATGATGFAVHFVFSMARLSGFLRETGGFWLALLIQEFLLPVRHRDSVRVRPQVVPKRFHDLELLVQWQLSDFGDTHGAHSTDLGPPTQLRVLGESRVRFAANDKDHRPAPATVDM